MRKGPGGRDPPAGRGPGREYTVPRRTRVAPVTTIYLQCTHSCPTHRNRPRATSATASRSWTSRTPAGRATRSPSMPSCASATRSTATTLPGCGCFPGSVVAVDRVALAQLGIDGERVARPAGVREVQDLLAVADVALGRLRCVGQE